MSSAVVDIMWGPTCQRSPDNDCKWTWRPCEPGDIMHVVDTWVGSYKRSKWAGTLPNNKFKEYMGEAIRQIIARGSKCILAVNPDRPSQILGWIVTERTSKGEPVVHYLFTKDIYRRRGISRSLLKQAGIPDDGTAFYTHKTNYSKHYNGKHVPEIARRKKA